YKQGFNSITNPEWIWGSYIDSTNATVYASFFSHMDANVYGYAQLGGQKKITKALYDQIASLDVRKQVFKTPGTGTTKEPEYCQTKFHLANPSKWVGDYLYMRTAEMYLIEAEAKARLGNYVSARAVLETLVKSRYPTYSAASFSGAALISEILLQRRIELWGEGFSLIDLKRTNAGLNRPTGAGNHGSPNLDPVVYSLPAGSQQMLWVTPSRDSGFVIPCEKVQKLIITKRIIKENINVSVCNSSLPYRWNGMDYTNNGTYFYFTTTSDNSCDSVAILNLVINKLIPILNNINLKNCNSITYKTKVYTASTIVRDTVKSYQGCDSIYNVATLTITKVTPTTSTVTLYGCNNIIYKGNSYITTTIVRDTVKSYQGCDSIYNVANIKCKGENKRWCKYIFNIRLS
ncbi:MAG: RagB/SusD family nutrient uptake outer membrane protein, partial [Bacteroidetes bacterium]|nr:RagB/SusD family nutrient uptake outer membrane protein [Bacteroidota bacterium]